MRRWLNRLEMDRAVFYSVSGRAWQFVAGPVTILLIAFYFTPELQGYFYTFASLLALQTFVELGLQVVIINVSSHEWARLSLDDRGHLTGDPRALSRLVSLGRKVAVWYGAASLVFVVGVGVAGVAFFWPRFFRHRNGCSRGFRSWASPDCCSGRCPLWQFSRAATR